MIAVMQLWLPKSQQHNLPLNEWITKVHKMVELCGYPDLAKDRIVRDILISGCNGEKAKDKIIRESDEPNLDRIIEILQVENSTKHSMKNIISNGEPTTAQVHYARYDRKSKSRAKAKNSNSTDGDSNSTNDKICYRCSKEFFWGHMKHCKTLDKICKFCKKKGHFENVCKAKQNSNSSATNSSIHSCIMISLMKMETL